MNGELVERYKEKLKEVSGARKILKGLTNELKDLEDEIESEGADL